MNSPNISRQSSENAAIIRNLEIVSKHDYFPTFQQPVIIGFYDLDANRQFYSSSVNLKYLFRIDPRAKLDLNAGFETYVPKNENLENVERIDSILLWLYHRKFLKNIVNSRVSLRSALLLVSIAAREYNTYILRSSSGAFPQIWSCILGVEEYVYKFPRTTYDRHEDALRTARRLVHCRHKIEKFNILMRVLYGWEKEENTAR